KEGGWVVTSSKPFINIPNYPDVEALMAELRKLPNLLMVDVEQIASEAGSARSANIVLLGAASPILGIEAKDLEGGIERIFSRKGEKIIASNIAAFQAGVASVAEQLKR
ncbi:MAG: 2-oxoacid:acceptor oxidoreductase family protein, partial [Rikenellaceae bacterium]